MRHSTRDAQSQSACKRKTCSSRSAAGSSWWHSCSTTAASNRSAGAVSGEYLGDGAHAERGKATGMRCWLATLTSTDTAATSCCALVSRATTLSSSRRKPWGAKGVPQRTLSRMPARETSKRSLHTMRLWGEGYNRFVTSATALRTASMSSATRGSTPLMLRRKRWRVAASTTRARPRCSKCCSVGSASQIRVVLGSSTQGRPASLQVVGCREGLWP
mmetsp:Transcript_42538/g.122974  ORF Transcript_42538/g.122974 Transcript_42538/m.122974 type:complete len:217 (+) Transcript_42538:851-1501(+)